MVSAINEELPDTPEIVNSDPYGDAWMVQIEISDASELDVLLAPAAYQQKIQEEE